MEQRLWFGLVEEATRKSLTCYSVKTPRLTMPEWLVTAMYISVVSCQFIDGIKFTFITEKHREYQSTEESGNNQDVKQVMHWKLTRNTQVLSG